MVGNQCVAPAELLTQDVIELLANAVPGRPIIAVYHHIRRIRHPLSAKEIRGKWTPQQDSLLQQYEYKVFCTHLGLNVFFQSRSRAWAGVGAH
jgi:hypothetical protein